ncbi:MAG: shikimate kinase [Candidatus Bathyarchaeia archaeon]
MTGKAVAIAHGAATIVNAIALGKGAAFGVDLWTKAEVKLTDEPHVFKAEITSGPKENTALIEKTVLRVLQRFSLDNSFGAIVKTWSNIPIAKGLKSSSAAANAVALAATAALGKTFDDLEIVKLGVDAAFDAKVTVTGAFDDACASYFGGVVITDNLNREIVKQLPLAEDLIVLFYVPPEKAYTADSNVSRLQTVKPLIEVAYKEALEGKVWEALTLNGLIYSSASGYDTSIAIDALAAGAVAAGLCGKGPAVTAVAPKDKVGSVKAALQKYDGEILQAHLNREKAKVL